MIYLDYNASVPLRPEARVALLAAAEQTGNPSSVHGAGRGARKIVEAAREEVAVLAGVKPAQVIFTSSGTEANNFALMATGRQTILTSAIEHDSILAAVPNALQIPVDSDGVIEIDDLHAQLVNKKPALVSVMLVNNETGVIQPVQKIAALAKSVGALVHADAVSAAGKITLDFKALDVDMMSLSAHKIGGGQGVGALIVREGLPLVPFIRGGGQEMRRRAGTENVSGIAAFGAAARAAKDLSQQAAFARWRDAMEAKLPAYVAGKNAPRVGNVSCLAMPGVSSEKQVVAFDLAGICVSAGAACSSGKVKQSHVLAAMGCGVDIASAAVRVSFGWNTQPQELDQFAATWLQVQQRLGATSFQQAA